MIGQCSKYSPLIGQIDKRERCSTVPAVKCEPAGPPQRRCRQVPRQVRSGDQVIRCRQVPRQVRSGDQVSPGAQTGYETSFIFKPKSKVNGLYKNIILLLKQVVTKRNFKDYFISKLT